MNKSVLYISYFFPPVGGAGVQRAVKFVKYLPEYGWTPTVLTVANPSVPLFDKSLESEIPDEIEICKAKTLEPGYAVKNAVSASSVQSNNNSSLLKTYAKKILRGTANLVLQPDPQILWMPAAYREGRRILKSKPFDAIIATGPPFSSFLLGTRLSKATGVPLLLDYRDEWDISNSVWENKKIGKGSLELQKKMQRYAIRNANALVATTQMSADALKLIAEKSKSESTVHSIYNGYDPEDFSISNINSTQPKNEKYQLSYVGTLWNLTSIEPLVKAIHILNKKHPELSQSLELVIAGRKTAEQEKILNQLNETEMTLTVHDYLDHSKAVNVMKQSNGLCLLLSDLELAGRVVPAKIFEYLACQKTVHAITPKGEVWNILKDYPAACCSEPSDINSIVQNLVSEIKQFKDSQSSKAINFDPSQYDRKNQTGDLADILDQISGKPDDFHIEKLGNQEQITSKIAVKK
jgi:glycosyltransferase involved in cell wall biosynthesis